MKKPLMTSLPRKKKVLVGLMSVLPAVMSPVFAQDNIWIGPSGGNFWDASNWSLGYVPSGESAVIQGDNSGIQINLDSSDPDYAGMVSADTLIIGQNSGNQATINVHLPESSPANLFFDGNLVLGDAGGSGTLTYEKDPNLSAIYGTEITISQNAILGRGTGSQGTLNILAQGKQLHEQHHFNFDAAAAGMIVGQDGGTGAVNVDGGSLGLDFNVSAISDDPAMYVGKGAGSNGTVNVLAGGKLGSSIYSYSDFASQGAIIGGEGGTGSLQISGRIDGVDGNPVPSRAVLAAGVEIGQGTGSIGTVKVVNGGLLRTFSKQMIEDPSENNTYKIAIGSENGQGEVLVSGVGSRWEISGDTETRGSGMLGGTGLLEIGGTGTGVLTISDSAEVALGASMIEHKSYSNGTDNYDFFDFVLQEGGGTVNIAETAQGKGTLNIGSALTEAAVAPGTIITDQIVFGAGDGQIVFNHTDTDYQFAPQLSGNGKLIQKSGTTWVNGQNNGLSGITELAGGTLGVSHNQALGSTSIIATNSANVQYAADVNLANHIEIQPAAQLSTVVADGLMATQSGIISGQGTLIKAGQGTLSLAGANSLTGDTQVKEGILKIEAGGDLRDSRVHVTSRLDVSNAGSTSIKSLAGNGQLALGTATLTINNAQGDFAGSIMGSGTVNIHTGTQSLSGNNQSFSGILNIDPTGHVIAYKAENLGMAAINANGTLTLDVASGPEWTLLNTISGFGKVTKQGAGTLVIDNIQDYTGKTTVAEGQMIVGSHSGSSAALVSSLTEVHAGASLGGYGEIVGSLQNAGTLLVGSAINGSDNFGTLTIHGDYVGQNGAIVLGTVLNDDTSPSDRLVIGGNAFGNSQVMVNNIHGLGNQTVTGIEIIEIQGQSSASFTLLGRAVAGAYEYELVQGLDGDWYLQSSVTDDQGIPSIPGQPGFIPGLPVNTGSKTPLYRTEAGSYLANIASANTLFIHQLNERLPQSVGKEGRSVWVRAVGSQGRFTDSTSQLNTRTKQYAVQLGGDLIASQLGNNSVLKFGAMFGYGYTESKTTGAKAGSRSTSHGNGYALGLYGTWFQRGSELEGAYVDSWIQYVHFDHEVKGSHLRAESYQSKGLVASLEGGYSFKVTPNLYIQPQAQITWMDVRAKEHREYNGTRVQSRSGGNLRSRVGVRAFGKIALKNGINLQPYAELNWIHNTKSHYVDMDGTRITQKGAKNTVQARVGLKADINQNLSAWGDVSYEQGKNSYREGKISVGLKYDF